MARATGGGLDRRAILRAGCLAALGAVPARRAHGAGPRRIDPYDFPLTNPYAATVVGTPTETLAPLPDFVPLRNALRARARPLPDRLVPRVFWYHAGGMEYGVAFRRRPAPLVVIVAGTGGGFNSLPVLQLARGLWAGGFHVVGVPSPTFSNFMVTALSTGAPGLMRDDTADLYRAISTVLKELSWLEVTEIHLTGLSLGGMNTAFLAELDARERRIGFRRALVLNPPVRLWNSVGILDGYFQTHLGNDPVKIHVFLERAYSRLASLFTREEAVDLSGNWLYRAYQAFEPTDAVLQTLIGMAFRLSARDITFTADVMTNSGYLAPKDARLTETSSLTPFAVSGRFVSFEDYFDNVFLPVQQRTQPTLGRDAAIDQADLRAVEGFLRSAPHVGLMTNEDDIILAPGEIDWLARAFGPRATLFPHGGHCGNYEEPRFVAELVDFFKTGWGGVVA